MANNRRDNPFGLPSDPFGFGGKKRDSKSKESHPFGLPPSPLNFGGGNNSNDRDSVRTFSRSQKNEIIERQDHLCAKCHQKLNLKATHYHHKIPYSEGGETTSKNGMAVCANCHAIMHHDEKVKRADSRDDDSRPNFSWRL
jgi:hypothetical protein